METKEKSKIVSIFGQCINHLIEENKKQAKENLEKGLKDHKSITSLRKLAASSGIEFSIIQKISAGKRNPALTTVISIADGFNLKPSELFTLYELYSESNNQMKPKVKRKRS